MTPDLTFLAAVFASVRGEAPHAPTLTEAQVLARLDHWHSTATLALYRAQGAGPLALNIDGVWLYFADSVEEWRAATAPVGTA